LPPPRQLFLKTRGLRIRTSRQPSRSPARRQVRAEPAGRRFGPPVQPLQATGTSQSSIAAALPGASQSDGPETCGRTPHKWTHPYRRCCKADDERAGKRQQRQSAVTPGRAPGENGPTAPGACEAAPAKMAHTSSAQDLDVVSPCQLIQVPVECIAAAQVVITT